MTEEMPGEEQQERGTERRSTRKNVLKAAGVVAGAAVAGKLVSADSASAADGADLQVGFDNTETQGKTTSLTTSVGTPYTPPAENPAASALKVTAPNFPYGIHGDARDYGVVGGGALAGAGVLGLGAVGGVFSGSIVAINLDPQNPPDAPSNPGPVDAPTGQAFQGDLAVNSKGVLWFCIAGSPVGGGPGTWIRLSQTGINLLPTPQRAYDSRAGGGKLRPGFGDLSNPRVIPIAGVTPGVPGYATGVVGNFTVTQEDAGGFATIWPSGPAPQTSTINFNAGVDQANAFTVGLGAGGNVSIAAFGGPTHVIIDIAGYIA